MSPVLTALLHGTVVAAATWGLELGLKRWVSSAFLSALWTVALVKFFLPVGPAFRFSVSSVVAQGQEAFAPMELGAGEGSAPGGMPWLLLGYAAVVAVLVARKVIAAKRLRVALAALPEASVPLQASVRRAAVALGLRSIPSVRVGAGPFVLGLWRPTLVLPGAGIEYAVLLHELAHLRRGDQWVRVLQTVAQVLFFFWPPVSLVNRKIEAHRELACDQAALTLGSLSATAYARVLLEAQRVAVAGAGQFAVLEMASRSSRLERRIDMLLTLKPGRSMKLGVVALAAWAGVALSGSALGFEVGKAEVGVPAEFSRALDRGQVQAVVKEHRGEIRHCYDTALAAAPLAGKLFMGWTITPSGATKDVRVLSAEYTSTRVPALETDLQRCIETAIGAWKFPEPRDHGELEVAYPFRFLSSENGAR